MDEELTCDYGKIVKDTVHYTALPYPLPQEYKTKLMLIHNNLQKARKIKRGVSIQQTALMELELEMRNKIGIKHKYKLKS